MASEEEQYVEDAVRRLDTAAIWLIEDGIPAYREDGHKYLKRYLIDTYKVNLWVTSTVESNRFLALFKIKSRGINYDIQSLFREVRGGVLYEFWILRVAAASWANADEHCRFFVTSSQTADSKRVILQQSDQFIPSFVVTDGSKVNFPVDDLRILYDMEAWAYPESYRGSQVPLLKVRIGDDGEYEFVDP